MRLVLDNNILFTLIKPDSVSSYLFASVNCEFIAPDFIKEELDKYKKECMSKSKLSEHEFEIRKRNIEKSIRFFEESEYENFLVKAVNNLGDPKDSPYLALALATESKIWSNDQHLKHQSLVKVFKTKDMIKLFFKSFI